MKPAAAKPPSFVVHNSNSEIGGAEASLLAAVAVNLATVADARPLFLVPAEGGLSRALTARGWEFRVLPWPRGLAALTQRRLWSLPLALPGLLPYLWRLRGVFRDADSIWSSGVKSHFACLLLSPWLRGRLLFDVRDFFRNRLIRRSLAFASARFGCRIAANSRAVAADYPGAEVRYPQVTLRRPAVDRRVPSGRRVIAHLAYFAPYKGQHLFLDCARALLDAGVDAEFLIIGDVIYPAESYARYREELFAQVGRLRLNEHVRFLGKLDGPEAVQEILERTDLLLHCTTEPEPFGRAVMEALLCGCAAVCHGGSGVCEVTEAERGFPGWMGPLGKVLGEEYVRVRLSDDIVGRRASGVGR